MKRHRMLASKLSYGNFHLNNVQAKIANIILTNAVPAVMKKRKRDEKEMYA